MTSPGADPHAPRHRVRPPSGWMNDPNGPFRWRGRYHVFFQANPDAPVHGAIRWGHASSADLADWSYHPVALAPVPGGPDEDGCWSGCTVDDGGVPTAVYTGVDRGHRELGRICLARAADPGDPLLTEWTQLPHPVVDGPPAGLDVTMFRDPFVFDHGGHRWALVGAGHADGTPSVLLYGCDDLTAWRFAGVFVDGRNGLPADGPAGYECPQLYRARDGRHVLIVSLWGGGPGRTAYLSGALSQGPDGQPEFAPSAAGPLDLGRDCYAPAVLQDRAADRVLLWGWSWEARPQSEVDEAGWAGVLTAPRVMDLLPDGTPSAVPAPELARLRGRALAVPGPLPDAYELAVPVPDSPLELVLLRAADGSALTLRLDPAAATATLDRAAWPRPDGAHREPLALPLPPTGTVRLLVDGSLLELFTGTATATERVYRRPADTASLEAPGGDGSAVRGWAVGRR